MEALARLDLVGVLRDIAASQKPMVGICLGMQLLMTESYEFGRHRGLDIIGGQVVRLRESPDGILRVKVPHVGWNCIHPVKGDGLSLDGHGSWKDSLLAGLPGGSFMYFVHSFYAKPVDPGVILSTTRYGQIEFCSSIRVQNVFGCQFHPERSGPQGLKVYQNLGTLIQRSILGREDVRETAGKVRTT
jgi:glutamine amidotransferase